MDNFTKLTELIKEYDENKNSYDLRKLQDLRDNISLTYFYLSEDFAKVIGYYDYMENKLSICRAEGEEKYRKDGFTISECENKAKIECKEVYEEKSKALKRKDRIKSITYAIPHILNSLSTRISMVNMNKAKQ